MAGRPVAIMQKHLNVFLGIYKQMNKSYLIFKRFLDVLCSLAGMVLSLPLWLIAVIGIEISDPGPVFYKATRVGKDNKTFYMFKFRSMRNGKANESVFRGEENRIFPFGSFIRATKIDELPQLINVFMGAMSIVGPRPAAVDQMTITRGGRYAEIGTIQVGLTGPSALYDYIYGDSIKDGEDYKKLVLPTRLKLDLVYLKRMSFAFDLKMIWWTIICVLAEVMHKKPERILRELKELADNRCDL